VDQHRRKWHSLQNVCSSGFKSPRGYAKLITKVIILSIDQHSRLELVSQEHYIDQEDGNQKECMSGIVGNGASTAEYTIAMLSGSFLSANTQSLF
jgi:hypothetical protein